MPYQYNTLLLCAHACQKRDIEEVHMPILSGVMNTYVGYALHAQDKTELHAIISLGVVFLVFFTMMFLY